jgi:hypothetical protein
VVPRGERVDNNPDLLDRMPICNGLDRGYYNEKYFIVEDTQLERVLTSKGVETEKAL